MVQHKFLDNIYSSKMNNRIDEVFLSQYFDLPNKAILFLFYGGSGDENIGTKWMNEKTTVKEWVCNARKVLEYHKTTK